MFDRILVPLDGSAEAESVLTWIRTWDIDSRLILFHCVPSRLPKGDLGGSSRFDSPELAGEYLESIARTIPGPTETIIRTGSPGDRIVTAALQAEAGLVLLGCGGDVGSPRTLGNVNEIVARTCPRPVMIVKTPAYPSRRRGRRILAPMDGSAQGSESTDILRGVARELRAEVILLHVGAPEPGEDASSYSDVQLNLIRQVWGFLKDGIAARTIMTKGSVVEETLTHEQSLDVDIVAVPRESHPGPQAWQAVLRQCERAVLLYEPKEPASVVVPAAGRAATLMAPRA
jgi:nucleotide-binding universal stress UspA family protein